MRINKIKCRQVSDQDAECCSLEYGLGFHEGPFIYRFCHNCEYLGVINLCDVADKQGTFVIWDKVNEALKSVFDYSAETIDERKPVKAEKIEIR